MPGPMVADERALFAKISRRLLPFLFLLYVVSYLDRTNVSFVGLPMQRELGSRGLNAEAFGLGGGIFFLGYFIFEVPSNLILQRIGARTWIARIMLTWGIIASCMMFVRGPRSFYLMRFLLGVAEAGFFPGIILYLTYWFPAPRRAKAVALFMTATAASGVIGALISTAILSLDGTAGLRGWQWVFILEGLPAIVLAAVVFIFLPNGPNDARWLNADERALLTDHLARENRAAPHRATDFLSVIGRGRVWLLTCVYFCLSLGMYCVSLWLPQLIAQAWPGHKDWQVTLLSGIPYACAAIGMVIIGLHSDRTGERRWHVAAPLLAAAGAAVCAALLKQPVVALVLFSIITMGIWASFGPFWSLPPLFLAGTAAAGGIAIINSFGNLGGFLGPYLFGAIKQHSSSFAGAFWVLAGFLILGALLILLARSNDRGAFEVIAKNPEDQAVAATIADGSKP
jgi:ACS family tartrate transporter-like MFS transporter